MFAFSLSSLVFLSSSVSTLSLFFWYSLLYVIRACLFSSSVFGARSRDDLVKTTFQFSRPSAVLTRSFAAPLQSTSCEKHLRRLSNCSPQTLEQLTNRSSWLRNRFSKKKKGRKKNSWKLERLPMVKEILSPFSFQLGIRKKKKHDFARNHEKEVLTMPACKLHRYLYFFRLTLTRIYSDTAIFFAHILPERVFFSLRSFFDIQTNLTYTT